MKSILPIMSAVLLLCLSTTLLTAQDKEPGDEKLLEQAKTLNSQAVSLYRQGKYTEAEPLMRRVLAIDEQNFGKDHPHVAIRLNNLAALLQATNRLDEAEPLMRRALAIDEQSFGKDHPNVAISLSNLAALLQATNRLPEAEPLMRRALAINEHSFGPDHPNTALSLAWLGHFYKATNRLAEAEPLMRRALAVDEQSFGKDHPNVAEDLNNLAVLLLTTNRLTEAESLIRRALTIDEQSFGKDHPDVARDLGNLAALLLTTNRLTEAEPLIRRVVKILENSVGEPLPNYTGALNNLAALLKATNRLVEAEPLMRMALAIDEQNFGKDHPNVARDLNNLTVLLQATNRLAEAEPLMRRALAIDEKSLGMDHPNVASRLNNLAMLLQDTNRLAEAELLMRRALAIDEVSFGKDHPTVATYLNNLASLLHATNRLAEAEPLYRRALAIHEKSFGKDHPHVARDLNNLAILLVARGKLREAFVLRRTSWLICERQRDRLFNFFSEQEQAAFGETLQGEIDSDLTLTAEHLRQDKDARDLALEVILSSKGSILEALGLRQSIVFTGGIPDLKQLFDQWQTAGQMLTKTTMAVPKPGQLDQHKALIAEQEGRKEKAEQALARASAPFASQRKTAAVKLTDVAGALPAGSVLVEFAKYQSHNFAAKGKESRWGDWKYVALVLRGGTGSAEPAVALVPLGSADAIEKAVKRWRQAVGPGERGRVFDRTVLESAGKDLAKLIWYPVASELGNCRKVYISADGELSFVSFAALPTAGNDSDRFMIDDYEIAYVGTGRDLVRTETGQGNPSLLVGDPDFGPTESTAPATMASADPPSEADLLRNPLSGISDLRSFAALTFNSLPGTRDEVTAIAGLLVKDGKEPTLLTGAKATEAALKSAKHPRILHLATHGFFLPDTGMDEKMSDDDLRGVGGIRPMSFATSAGDLTAVGSAAGAKLWQQLRLQNPMHRSGVALAGANDTIRGRHAAGGDDGLLTAEEVAGLDLWGTRLVVISACESGVGEAKGGEGVFGLRRAFTMAGAQNLVMSLWSVSDKPTQALMTSLYENLDKTGSPPRALLAAQRDWIAKERAAGRYPHPFYWAAFVASGTGMSLEKQ